MDPLVNYTTWCGWMMDVLWWTFRSTFVLFRALFDLILLRIALRLHFLVLKPVAR
jgi:hypothetical protein